MSLTHDTHSLSSLLHSSLLRLQIGLATAQLLASEGAAAITIIARDQRKLDEAVPLIRQANSATTVRAFSADVSDRVNVQAACEAAVKEMGGVDAVICSAGASYPSLFVSTSESEFERLMRINFTGIVYVLKAIIPHMLRANAAAKKRGESVQPKRVVLISSMAGLSGVAGYTAYSASKFALRGMAEALHMELSAPAGIAVSLVNPPDVDTPMLHEENKLKPKECSLISEGSGVFSAQDIAKDIVAGMHSYKFLINTGFDGHLLSIIAAGTAPATSALRGAIETFFGGLLRLISTAYRAHYNRIVAKVHAEREAGQLDDHAAQAWKAIVEAEQRNYGSADTKQ